MTIKNTHTHTHGYTGTQKMQQKKNSTSRNNTKEKKHDRSVAQYYTLDNKHTLCHLATNNIQRFLTILHWHIAHVLGARLIKQAVGGRPPRYAPAQACKWWHDIRHVRIDHHYCMSMLACQYNQLQQPGNLDFWHFDLESGVRVMCDVGHLCANFSLPRPLCSRVRPDVRDRQTDVRLKHRLMLPPIRGGA